MWNEWFCVIALIATVSASQQKISDYYNSSSLDFIMVADFGNFVTSKGLSYLNFDKLSEYVSTQSDAIDGIIIPGDIMYPSVRFHPSKSESQQLMGLFRDRSGLNQVPIYHVRGNHDLEYSYEYYQNYTLDHSQWLPLDKYYYELVELKDGSGMKALMIFLDTMTIICHYGILSDYFNCTEEFAEEGRVQFEWLEQVLQTFENDTQIAWRVVVQHHVLFNKENPDDIPLIKTIMPLFIRYNVDLFLTGHEHAQMHAYTNKTGTSFEYDPFWITFQKFFTKLGYLYDQSWVNSAVWPQRWNEATNTLQFNKSEPLLHQFTDGSGGYNLQSFSSRHPSQGTFTFIQNQYFGFSHIKITAKEFEIKYLSAADAFTEERQDTFEGVRNLRTVVIQNDIHF